MKTNILLIHESMSCGGAERVLYTLLNNIDRTRFNITLLLIFDNGVYRDEIPGDIEVISLFDDMRALNTRILNHFRVFRNYIRKSRARRKLEGRTFDITVSFMEGPTAKLHSQLMDLSPRNISWVHTNLSTGRWYGTSFLPDEERQFYDNVDKIAFVSDESRDTFKKLFDVKAGLHTIYNPIDLETIRANAGDESKAADEPFTIVNVGRLVNQKAHHRLIRAAKILKDRGMMFRINIIGSGPLENELEALSKKLGTEDCVSLLGFKRNPYTYVKQSDVFCLTSVAEGYAIVVAESICVGTPVVSTPLKCVNEMLMHGGGIFTSEKPEDIADKLQRLMEHPAELAALKDETAVSAQQFRLDNVVDKIMTFITE